MDIRYFYVSDHIQNKTVSLKDCPAEEMLADYFTKPLQGALFTRLRYHIMGAEFANGDSQTRRSVLDDDDHDTWMEASSRDQEASERDQNNEEASERDQNNENVCDVRVSSRDQNNENVHDAGEAHNQNNTNVYGTNPHFGGKNGKQMTYREALLGLDNSEPSSDF